jgi:hypothetical protein
MSNFKIQLTDEQGAIVQSPLSGITKVIARAGTGKTSTLNALSRSNLHKRGLYIAFNKAIQVEAQSKFPPTVKCSTAHALAFSAFGRKYSKKLCAGLRLNDVISYLGMDYDYPLAKDIVDAVNGYCTSDLREFPLKKPIAPDRVILGNATQLEMIGHQSKKLWEMMCDPSSIVGMTHDGYLKLYQLSNPLLPFDYIMLDEAQDTNPVTASIVLAQKCPIVLVGDPYQAIYGFRGAQDAMQPIVANQEFYLTNSFRFGPKVAEIASLLLSTFYDETHLVYGKGFNSTVGTIDRGDQKSVLCRTNAEIFSRAVGCLIADLSIGFVGGVNSYAFDKIHDAYLLYANDKSPIRDSFIKGFIDFDEFSQYADDAGDLECKMLVKVVHQYQHDIPHLISEIKSNALPSYLDADRILSTAHKCKGLDLPRVEIAEDFWSTMGIAGPIPHEERRYEEINLTYVAVTRAVQRLQLNSDLGMLLKHHGIN